MYLKSVPSNPLTPSSVWIYGLIQHTTKYSKILTVIPPSSDLRPMELQRFASDPDLRGRPPVERSNLRPDQISHTTKYSKILTAIPPSDLRPLEFQGSGSNPDLWGRPPVVACLQPT